MLDYERILKIFDAAGNLRGVILPPDIWQDLEAVLGKAAVSKDKSQEDFSGFKDLMQAWNFRYPYDPSVKCQCGSCTTDWRSGEPRLFKLVTANLGGLLVFHCASCGRTVRQKYFKDHMVVEYSDSGNL